MAGGDPRGRVPPGDAALDLRRRRVRQGGAVSEMPGAWDFPRVKRCWTAPLFFLRGKPGNRGGLEVLGGRACLTLLKGVSLLGRGRERLKAASSATATAPIWVGSKLSHQGTAGFCPCFHLPGFHFLVPIFNSQPF